MANYCNNKLTIYASWDVLERIQEYVLSDYSIFDFERIIPIPDEIHQSNAEYEWCINNWGTKSNTIDACLINECHYSFFTAYVPCLPVIEALAKHFPEAKFVLRYYEIGFGIAGTVAYINGQLDYSLRGTYKRNTHWFEDGYNADGKYGYEENVIPLQKDGDYICGEVHIRDYARGQIVMQIDGEIKYRDKLPSCLFRK